MMIRNYSYLYIYIYDHNMMRRLVEIMSAWGDCDYGHNSLIDFVYNGMKAITRALPLTVVL